MFIYERVALEIQRKIESGAIKGGDKLDSVRSLSKKYHISLTTAFKVYEELVNRKFLEARYKSGYFAMHQKPRLPDISTNNNDNTLKLASTNKIIAFAFRNLSNKHVVRLSVNAPHVSLLPVAKLKKSMKEALNMSDNGCLNYERVEGNTSLREQIVRHSLQGGFMQDPEDVVITQGCIESLVLSLMTITKPGDTVLVERPTYFSIYSIIKNLRLNIVEIDVHPIDGISFTQLEKCLKKVQVSACIIITNFNNPTGHCMLEADKENLVHMLSKKEIPLIEDDIYGEIYFGGHRPKTCKQFDKRGLVLLCSSISKSLAPGYRVGWCLPGKFKERYLEMKMMHTISAANPTQAAAAIFFQSGRYDLHIKKLRKTLHLESLKYLEVISQYFPEGTKVTRPKGGFVLWIELPPAVDAIKLFYAVMDHGISIFPGPIFSASGGFKNFIRISFGEPLNDKIESGLRLIGEKCEEMMG